jgi:hypothetical protein
MDSWPFYACFLYLRPGIAVMEEVLFKPDERNNSSTRPGYAVFGGQFIPRVTVSMKNSIIADGISFRLLEDGSLLLTTPAGQYHIQAPGVADLFDLLSAGQGGFLDASSDLPTWAREITPDRLVIGHLQIDEETPRSLETYREQREQR